MGWMMKRRNLKRRKRATTSGRLQGKRAEEEQDDIPVPFPSKLLQGVGKDKYSHEIQQIFTKCSLNIPLLEAIKKVPKYAKYLKGRLHGQACTEG